MPFEEQLRQAFDKMVAELGEAARIERERAREQGRDEGVALGRDEGLAQGREQGHAQGRDEGHARGREEGRAQGREEGLAQGWEDGREHGRFEARQEAGDGGAAERLLDGFRAIARGRSLSEILDTLAGCTAREAGRAGVFLVSGATIRGWRFVGFDGPLTSAPAIDIPIDDAGVVGTAVTSGAAATAETAPPFAHPAAGRAVAVPIDLAGEVVAAVYADGAPPADQPSAQLPADGPRVAAIEALARHAGLAIQAMVAFKAARALTSADRTEQPDDGTADTEDADASARRYARLLVSEIKLYHEPAVVAGRRDRDLASRLGGEIARARVLYDQRVPDAVRRHTDYFQDELVRTLANGDPSLLQMT
jgi:hypothetical protein